MMMIKLVLIIINVLVFLLSCTSAPEAVEEAAQPSLLPSILGEDSVDKDAPSTIPRSGGIPVEVKVLGKQGFNPREVTASVGQEVVFINNDEKMFSMTFVKDGTKIFENSDLTEPGASYTHLFKEPGRYRFWTIGYGVQGTATVR